MLVVNCLRYVILHPTARDFVTLVKLQAWGLCKGDLMFVTFGVLALASHFRHPGHGKALPSASLVIAEPQKGVCPGDRHQLMGGHAGFSTTP